MRALSRAIPRRQPGRRPAVRRRRRPRQHAVRRGHRPDPQAHGRVRGAPRRGVRRAVADGSRANADALALRDLDVPESNVLAETFRSVSTIPLSQTMGDQIAALRRRNARVLALRSVIEQRFDAVAERVDAISDAAAAGGANPLVDPAAGASARLVGRRQRCGARERRPDADLRPRQDRPRRRPLRRSGRRRLRISDGLSRELVAEVIRRYRRRRRAPARASTRTRRRPKTLSDRQIGFLRAFDVDYERPPARVHARWRRLALPAPGPGAEPAVDRAQVDSVKRVLAGRAAALCRRVGRADGRRRAPRAGDRPLRARRAQGPHPAAGASTRRGTSMTTRRVRRPPPDGAAGARAAGGGTPVDGVMDGFGHETFAGAPPGACRLARRA